jgi:hypothetical protein
MTWYDHVIATLIALKLVQFSKVLSDAQLFMRHVVSSNHNSSPISHLASLCPSASPIFQSVISAPLSLHIIFRFPRFIQNHMKIARPPNHAAISEMDELSSKEYLPMRQM